MPAVASTSSANATTLPGLPPEGGATQLPLAAVRLTRGLLAERAATVRDTAIPSQWEALNDRIPGAERSGAVSNFQIAAGEKQGPFHGHCFQDSDLAKWIEAASHRLATHPDPALDATLDTLIATIAKAQQPDGYLDTYIQIKEPGQRWANLHENHELYIAGHIIEAAVAHHAATGKRSLLDIARKLADLIDRTFGAEPGKIPGYCGHEEIELALVKLARAAREPRYLALAAWFVNQRGAAPNYFEAEIQRLGIARLPDYFYHDRWDYLQAGRPVREQTQPAGHCVRAMYLFAAMAALARDLPDPSLRAACETLWREIAARHHYITGGIGSEWMGEKFSAPYDLPNDRAYAETCAAIGLLLFSRAMLDLQLRGEYADLMERALYNNILAGMSPDGCRFFYVNPLEVTPALAKRRYDARHVKTARVPWFGCACCPPNIARTLASLGHHIASRLPAGAGLALHLYTGCEIETTLGAGGTRARLRVETDYPWDETVRVEIKTEIPARFTLAFRLPGWCRAPAVHLNNTPIALASAARDGYLHLDREWRSGDILALTFPMPVERVRSHPGVAHDAGCVALQRGPIVYCVEETDNGARLAALQLPRDAPLRARHDTEFLGGAVVIDATAQRLLPSGEQLYTAGEPLVENTNIKAVPYFLWANRGEGEMRVWLREA